MKIALFVPMTFTQAREVAHAWPFDWIGVTASVLRWPELNSFEAPPDRYDMFPLFDEEVADGVQEAIALDKKHGFSHMLIVSRSTTVYHRLRLLMVTGEFHEVRIYLAHDGGQVAFDLSEDGQIKPEDDPKWPASLFGHSARECSRLIRAHVARADRLRATGTTRSDGQPDLP